MSEFAEWDSFYVIVPGTPSPTTYLSECGTQRTELGENHDTRPE
jgi:hypothetical protein